MSVTTDNSRAVYRLASKQVNGKLYHERLEVDFKENHVAIYQDDDKRVLIYNFQIDDYIELLQQIKQRVSKED